MALYDTITIAHNSSQFYGSGNNQYWKYLGRPTSGGGKCLIRYDLGIMNRNYEAIEISITGLALYDYINHRNSTSCRISTVALSSVPSSGTEEITCSITNGDKSISGKVYSDFVQGTHYYAYFWVTDGDYGYMDFLKTRKGSTKYAPPANFYAYYDNYSLTLDSITGCTLSAIGATTVSTGGTFLFRANITTGYMKGPDFTVKANETIIYPNENGVYIISNVKSNLNITVSGVISAGLVHINNGTNYSEVYLCYIYDADGWSLYLPYIYNGSSWELYGG